MLFNQFAEAKDLSPAELASRLSAVEARVALAERTAGMGTWRWRIGEDMPDWTPGLYRILGLDPTKPPVPGALAHMAHPEDRELFITAIRSVMESPGPFFFRYRLIRTDGGERHLDVSGDVETDDDGRLVAIIGIITDVSRRVEAEDQLRSAMDAFRVLTEEANDLICRHDASMQMLYCSPAIVRILGYEPEEMLGRSFMSILHPEDMPSVRRNHLELLTPGASQSIVSRMRNKAGAYVWVETVCRAIGDRQTGRVTEFVTVSRDVTARKTAEIEINRARETAESANRTKSRFLATMSHELRTPLNAIIGFSDMLKAELFGPLTPRYKEYSELIHESGTLLLDLINDILDMSKIEAGRFELSLETFDAAETVEACARLLKPKAEQSGLTLEIDATEAPLNADKRAVKQILLNLMSNAIKFTPRGGRIRLTTTQNGEHTTLTVADSGIGIPAADLPRLGRPFEQAAQDAALAKAGTGLGLALVRSLAQLHGGDIAIESELGRGTSVTVMLPTAALAAKAA